MYHHFNSGHVAVILITDSRPFEFSVPRTSANVLSCTSWSLIMIFFQFLTSNLLIVGV